MSKYHYEYFVYTDNLNYGRVFIGQSPSRKHANRLGQWADKGCFVVEKRRVYDIEQMAESLNGKNLLYSYYDGSKPIHLNNLQFMFVGKNGYARFIYTDGCEYSHELHLSEESISNLLNKGFCKYSYGTLSK